MNRIPNHIIRMIESHVCCADVAEMFWSMWWNRQILNFDDLTCSQIEALEILIVPSNLL